MGQINSAANGKKTNNGGSEEGKAAAAGISAALARYRRDSIAFLLTLRISDCVGTSLELCILLESPHNLVLLFPASADIQHSTASSQLSSQSRNHSIDNSKRYNTPTFNSS